MCPTPDGSHARRRSVRIGFIVVAALNLMFHGRVDAASSSPPAELSAQKAVLAERSDVDEVVDSTSSTDRSPDAANSDSIAYAETASQTFGTVDLKTGVFKSLGNMSELLCGMGVVNGKLYGAGWQTGTLYTVNTSNGKLTAVGSSSIAYSVFGSTANGVLYATGNQAQLYSIDPSNGAATLIGPLGISYSGYWSLSVNSSTLYFSNDTDLYTLDTSTGAATLVGSMGQHLLGALLFEDNVLWGGEESPELAVATLNPATGAAKTGPAFTGAGSGTWWAIAPSPVPPVASGTSLKASTTTATFGTSVSFTALVTSVPGTSTPTGKVSFVDGSKTLSTVTLNGAGQGTYSTSSLAVGSHSMTAKYLGTSGDKSSTSSAVNVSITGGPGATLSTTSLSYGNEAVAGVSAAKSVTLTNSGAATLTLSSIKLTGSQADDFAMTTTCGSTLAAKASCTIAVKFSPVSTGAKAAVIDITDNAADSPQAVSLTGTGVAASSAPVVKLSASSLTFGAQPVKKTSASQSVKLSNTGNGTLTIGSIKLGGGQADDFGLSTNCGTSVAAGTSCTLTVTFTPVSTGAKAASISITDNAASSPQTISLSGTGA